MEKTEIGNRIYKFIDGLPEYTAGGMSINDIKYDGIPIWWFFKAKFREGKLPLQLPEHRKIVSDIAINKKITILESVKNQLKAYLFAKFIRYNEELKIFISRFNKKQSKMVAGKGNIMFLVHTNAILFDKSKVGFAVDRFESVVNKIREDNELQEYISVVDPMSHNSFFNLLRYENLIYRYMDRDIRKIASGHASRLHNEWKNIKCSMHYDSNLEFRIYEYIKPAMDFVFSKDMIYLVILYYEAYKRVIRENKINLLLIYADSGIITRCAIKAADASNVDILHISHGTGVGVSPDLSDILYHAVIGEDYRREYIKQGIAEDRIFVTGPLFMDDIVKYKKENYDNEKKHILFLTWPINDPNLIRVEEADYINFMKRWIGELNTVGDVKITIKPHPREIVKVYESIVNSLGYRNIDIIKTVGKTQTKDFLYSLIRNSDLVISFGSTASIESIIIGTPSIIINLFGPPNDPIMREGIINLGPEENISGTVKELLYNKEKIKGAIENGNQKAKEYLYAVDGRANERVMEIIKRLLY